MADEIKKYEYWAIPVLVFLHVLLAFFLLFEERLVVPYWVQPLGRLHPLMLHFPIVLVLAGAGLPLIKARLTPTTFHTLWQVLWVTGTVSALVVSLMGLLLAREGGYEASDLLQRHKWSGVGVAWLSSILYLMSYTRWLTPSLQLSGSLLAIVGLVAAGHWGATLTHGEHFVTAPLRSQWLAQNSPTPEEALVYEDIIRPILEQKCVSCHNSSKMKGELRLSDPDGMRKGGKSGPLWAAGKPEESLLMERLLLPLDAKEHMPPKEKPQLSSSEIALLSYWVKAKASFTDRLASVPAHDSLRILAEARLAPSVKVGPRYDFAAASPEVIQRLQTDFRSVSPVAQQEPALAVHFFSKAAYSTQRLEEIQAIEPQVVALNLSRMPVKDQDLALLKGFVQLEKLNLNFTDIDGSGLVELERLRYLTSLSLAGTRLTANGLEATLGRLKQLRTVAVWNTPIPSEALERIRQRYPAVTLLSESKETSEAPMLRLNPPVLRNGSTVFRASATALLAHPIQGVTIRYTLDGSEPDSLRSPIFNEKNPPQFSVNTSLKARVYKEGWLGSKAATFNFYKSTYTPDSIRVLSPLSRVHQGLGKASFFDGILGGFNANSPAWANHWLGIRTNDMALLTSFKKPIRVQAVGIRSLTETETGIFPPAELEVWGGSTEQTVRLLGKIRAKQPTENAKPYMQYWESTFREAEVSVLKIVIKPLKEIPSWHGAKGRPALLLVDEIFIN